MQENWMEAQVGSGNIGKETLLLSLLNSCHALWEVNAQSFCHVRCRTMEIMDRNYFRAKFGHAQFQHLQVIFLQHQDLHSHF